MLLNLGMWPIALMIFVFLIPLIYCVKWKKKEFRDIALPYNETLHIPRMLCVIGEII